jgi:5-methylcytosine-specific restriction endonuclease McrA
VPKATPFFRKWTGTVPENTYNNKPVLDFDGEMVFAELAILRAFERAGWEGRWIDSYRNRYRIGYWGENVTKELPAEQRAILGSIHAKGGCFDVFCWRDGAVMFAESKWKDRDAIRETQRRWLEAALDKRLSLESFLIVEWGFERESRPPLSKKLQLRVFRRDKWVCRWCSRPVIFAPVMKFLESEVNKSSRRGPLSYYHAHWTRAGAPLLDELGAVIDHVDAFSTGGSSAEDNLATSCCKCNAQKSAGTVESHQTQHPRKPIKGKYGEPQHWDGLSSVFVILAVKNRVGLSASEKGWLKVLTEETSAE